jgi:hypothetical protein
MRRLNSLLSSSKRLAPAVALIVALAAGSAYAYFTTTVASGGNGGSSSDSLPPGSTPEVSLSGANVTVSFSQSTVGGKLLGAYTDGGYTVKRYPASGGSSVTPGTSCDTTISGSSEKLSCTESNVPPGSWKYTVTPVLNNWVGTESAQSAAVTIIGPPAKVAVQSGSPQSATVNTAFGSALVALVTDVNGNPVPGVSVTFTAPSFGASGTFANATTTTTATTASNGQATASAFTANTVAGGYTVSASVSGVSATAGFSLTNNPGAATKLTVSGFPSPAMSGTSQTFTVAAKDTYGNLATGYTGTVKFTSSDSGAVLPANYTFTTGSGHDNGTHTFSATLKTAGTQSITATDTATSTITGSQTGIVVTASKLVLGAATTTPAAGAPDNLTITAEDVLGHTATNYTGSHSLTFNGASPSPNNTQPTVTNSSGAAVNFGSSTAISFSEGAAKVTGANNGAMTLYDAQTASITLSDGTIDNSASPLSVAVSPPGAPAAGSTKKPKCSYTDKTNPTPDTIVCENGTVNFENGETSLALVAIETAGAHVNQQFVSSFVPSTGNGSVPAFNVDNATAIVSYKFVEEDPWGNVGSAFAGPFAFTDTK